jgi:hypothetical protein
LILEFLIIFIDPIFLKGSFMKDLNKVALFIGISVIYLENVLDIPPEPCDAPTIEKARKEYYAALKGSEKERAALARWEELSMERVEAASNLDEAKEAFSSAIQNGKAEHAAIKKIYEFFPEK